MRNCSPPTSLSFLLICLSLLHPGSSNESPQFSDFTSVFYVEEDKEIGYILGQLKAVDNDNTMLDFSIQGDVAKRVIELIRVGPQEMNIRLKEQLDREPFRYGGKVVNEYTFFFFVTDGVNTVQKQSSIYILDVNDNSPAFMDLPYRAEVPEDAVLGTAVYMVTAEDPDQGKSGVVSYFITPGQKTPQGLFVINQYNGNVTLNATLDYEKEKFYQLEIKSQDNPQSPATPLESTTDLVINVKDVQDTPPFFLNLPYIATVFENASVGTSILQVSALDGDRGVPNEVRYTITPGTSPTNYFHLDANSGLITVNAPMSREDPLILEKSGVIDMNILAEEVTATPKGPTTASTVVTIRILDINDKVPTFSQPSYQATVLENTQARIPVTLQPEGAEINVQDHDEGNNGRFELFLERGGQPFDLFEVVPTRVLNEANCLIRVKNTTAVDYELVTSYTFQIVAREYLTAEARQSRATVTVTLEDVNDNWPEFGWQRYSANLSENARRDEYIVTVTATDQDVGQWGDITYRLRGASANLFRVEPRNGEVFVNVDADQDHTLLDREKQDQIFLTVEALDGGGLRASVQLEVRLQDENDNAPEMARPEYEGYVRESQAELDRPVIIEATDIDLGPYNNDIAYSVESGDPLRNFTLDRSTGRLSLAAPLDYEAMDPSMGGRFELVVVARDQGTPPLSSTTRVTVVVQDANDEAPYFLDTSYAATLPENSTAGTVVTRVTAVDHDDTAPNNEILYRIESGAKDKFRIDAETGVISVESGANLDRDLFGRQYLLRLLAIDRGTPPLTGAAVVDVTVTDVNDKFPVFTPSSRITSISEGALIGEDVILYSAVDTDDTAELLYKLLDSETYGEDEKGVPVPDTQYLISLFGVMQDSGQIYVKSALDREQVAIVWIRVFVEDRNAQQPPSQNATGILQITLMDINDNPPTFDPSNVYAAQVSEASKPGYEVTRVLAVDEDKNPEPVKYYMVYDTEESRALEITDVNRLTGKITLAREVDHEVMTWINVTVTAVDSGTTLLTSTATVNVLVEDVNDNSPTWQIFPPLLEIWENVTAGTVITQVRATDLDSGEFGRVAYFITNGAMGQFAVNSQDGTVTSLGELDRESVAQYSLTFEARDNNLAAETLQRKTPGYMRLLLKDVNDNAPQFERIKYTATTQENVNQQHVVVTVRATDADADDNGRVAYSVDTNYGNASHLFDVKSPGGEVFVQTSLVGQYGVFILFVKATDGGHPQLSNTTSVEIQVEDVNDHSPVFTRPPNGTVTITENVPIGYLVVQVAAVDLDQGGNGMVQYEAVTNPSNRDWQSFHLDSKSGNITTTKLIDRETQARYILEVRAYDLGTPSYDDRMTLTIEVLDVDDNPPGFNRTRIPLPYHVSVPEEASNTSVAYLNLAADPDASKNALICYYIVGGNQTYVSHFEMKKLTGELRLVKKLDRETVKSTQLVVKATKDCSTDHWLRPENTRHQWNATDVSLLLVKVQINDVNDNPPQFTQKWFTAGVSRDVQHNEEVINFKDYVVDKDEGANRAMYFYILPPFRYSRGLSSRFSKAPFVVNPVDGKLRTDVYFQEDMRGYIEFDILVNDSTTKHSDKANVSIYLLHKSQRVKIVLRGSPDDVGAFKDVFAQFLSNITKAIINVDLIRTHMDSSGKPDTKWTDMFIHGINRTTLEVMSAGTLVALIDKNYPYLVDLFRRYAVKEVMVAEPTSHEDGYEWDLVLALGLVSALLFLLIIILCVAFCVCRNKDKRKLKAATAMAFEHHNNVNHVGGGDSGLNKLELPNTNSHTIEGSNPIWLAQYGDGWPADSDTDSKNSLDENTVAPPVQAGRAYDEQEMSMHMYNDDYDHYNQMPPAKHDPNTYLKAALQDHQATTKQNSSPNQPPHVPPRNHNNVPNNKQTNIPGVTGNSVASSSPSRTKAPRPTNGNVVKNLSSYDNVGYQPDGLNGGGIYDGMESTEI